MIRIESILVPVDFSGPSKVAINYGLSLALQFKTKLILAHVLPDYHGLNYAMPPQVDAVSKQAYEDAQRHLGELVPAEYRDRLEVESIIKVGDVRSEILDIVRDKTVDLVVMGSHGRRAFKRFVIGSVTESVLRHLPIPVLTVSHLDPEKEIHVGQTIPLKRILYATDLSEDFEAGMAFSVRLVRDLNAGLTVVHAFDMVEQVLFGEEMVAYPAGYRMDVRKAMQDKLDRRIASASEGSIAITTVLADGPPYQAINDAAEKINADLIVMNLQGKGRIERALLGSTAERLIRSATVPVLSLPMPATYLTRWTAS